MQEVIDVEIDEGLPGVDGDERPEREEGAERDRRLAALPRAPLRAITTDPDEHAGEQRDQERRRRRRAPRNRPITPASLTSPMPMPPG